MNLPRISTYCNRGDGANSTLVEIGPINLYFSYQTCVAFRFNGKLVCSENVWSVTTGRHLNAITDKSNRVPHDQFQREMAEVLATIVASEAAV